ncbi:MAG: anhydro-N-acetylmuramic acid kinase [Aquamicrobium sp.]|uniref:anhydro-N-acetylmuramic acid kinase n=1 Tax=Aquamicrobium sp. TaxID=1872579 RepID=UPI00349E65D5|nr:anhydro-N-acetylmuramic acid kinase [Aquamicrobium sp.]
MTEPVWSIGLMSGTSMDGIDVAAVETDGRGHVQRGPGGFLAYDAAFRARIEAGLDDARTMAGRQERPGTLAVLERDLTLRHAGAVKRFLTDNPGFTPRVIGFHGQTVLHRPDQALTVQLGDGALLARETGVPVVYDMRANDMAHGGQGAPLVPVYHAALAASLPAALRSFPVCFVNIGGISNVTFIPEAGDPVAFDSGPGNALIDQWVQRGGGPSYDEDGRIAAGGGAVEDVVARYLDAPFFDEPAPKSLDRGDFTTDLAQDLSLEDGARTLAAVSAAAILKARAHMPEPPLLWIVCGGGRKNPAIMEDLRRGAGNVRVIAAEEAGFDGDAMEAEAWAYLAVRALNGLPLTFPTTTGCARPVTGGVLVNP